MNSFFSYPNCFIIEDLSSVRILIHLEPMLTLGLDYCILKPRLTLDFSDLGFEHSSLADLNHCFPAQLDPLSTEEEPLLSNIRFGVGAGGSGSTKMMRLLLP
jgi:hypothetical protein